MEPLLTTLRSLHPDVDFEGETQLIERGILDSFDIVTLVSEIDIDYGVVIPPEELTPENLNSAQALFRLISRLKED